MAPVRINDFAAAPHRDPPPCPLAPCPVSAGTWGSGAVPLACLLCRLSGVDRGARAQVLAAMEGLADELSRRRGRVQGLGRGPVQGPD